MVFIRDKLRAAWSLNLDGDPGCKWNYSAFLTKLMLLINSYSWNGKFY